VSTVTVTPGVTINVPSVMFIVLWVCSMTFLHQPPILETLCPNTVSVETIPLGTLIVTPGVTGTVLTYMLPTGRAPCLPSIYGQNDTLCKSEHLGGEL